MNKTRTLIVKTTRAALLEAKQELIAKLEKKGNMVKWSDYAVESKSELFIFKVLSINVDDYLNVLQGYDFVKADEFINELEATVTAVKHLIYPTLPETPPNPAPEAQNEPPEAENNENGEKVDEGTENDSKDKDNKDNKDKVPF
ncbi:hypothetical protein KAU11_11990 [Candidatus Babeliales bacterium]|nr:hypothetical protein [Candidatus Babeliales bacterium]